MTELILFFVTITSPFLITYLSSIPSDPAPGLTYSKTESRSLLCKTIPKNVALNEHPADVKEESKNNYIEESIVSCERPVFVTGERNKQDEEILSTLSQSAQDIAQAARVSYPSVKAWTVLVDYPSSIAAEKISFAVEVALKNKEGNVSDLPLESEDDLLEKEDLVPEMPSYCRKLKYDDASPALLRVSLVDKNETSLHAGVCNKGEWKWLL